MTPFAVGSFCVEFSVQQIFILVYLLLQLFPLSAPADFRQQTVAFHKSEDGFGILVVAVLVQPELHSAIAVGILTPFLLTCNLIYDCLIRVWLAQSLNIRIIPASGNAKESAHPVNGMVLPGDGILQHILPCCSLPFYGLQKIPQQLILHFQALILGFVVFHAEFVRFSFPGPSLRFWNNSCC